MKRTIRAGAFPGVMLLLMLLGAGAMGASCGAEKAGSDMLDVGAAERQAIGAADPYPADRSLRNREHELTTAMKQRRALGWSVVEKVLAPVKLKAEEVKILGDGQTEIAPTIPRWQTWYHKDEFKRMFQQLYRAHGKENRRAKAPFSEALLAGDPENGRKGIFEWNSNYLAEKGLSQDLYTGRIAKLETQADVHGLSGAESISYSPALVMHFYRSYANVLRCLQPVQAGSSATVLDRVQPDEAPASDDNFTLCFGQEAPVDAVITKAFWSSEIVQPEIRTYDTSAAALSARLSSGDGGWGEGDGAASPGADRIHTLETEDGTKFRLSGLHIMTKELRHWLWVSLWWSADPDSDFGADRPSTIAALGPAWQNYKMCVVAAFDEGDPDPRGGYPSLKDYQRALADAGLSESDPLPEELSTMKRLVSLGDALAATYRGAKGPTWCSNPYIEEGPRNARSNCIGCHQHAGTPMESLSVLSDEQKYSMNGTGMARKNHPADYIWAFDKAARLARVIQSEAGTQDLRDR